VLKADNKSEKQRAAHAPAAAKKETAGRRHWWGKEPVMQEGA
jgi:hypothetical protein